MMTTQRNGNPFRNDRWFALTIGKGYRDFVFYKPEKLFNKKSSCWCFEMPWRLYVYAVSLQSYNIVHYSDANSCHRISKFLKLLHANERKIYDFLPYTSNTCIIYACYLLI